MTVFVFKAQNHGVSVKIKRGKRKENMKKNNHDGDGNLKKNNDGSLENLRKNRSKMLMTGSSSNVFYFGNKSVLPELPKDILEEIIRRVGTYINYVRLRAVCKSLRYTLPERPFSEEDDHHQRLLPRQLPWLVLRSYLVNEQGQLCHGFFSLSEKKIHRLSDYSVNNSSSSSNGFKKKHEYLIGSCRGWLVTVEKIKLSVSLLNPITRNRIRLPPLTTFPNYISSHPNPNKPSLVFHQVRGLNSSPSSVGMSCRFLTKVILIPTGIKKQFMIIAMLLVESQLALFKSEDQDEGGKWVLIDLKPHGVGLIQDVVHFKGQIYVADYYRIYAYDIGSGGVRIVIPKMPQRIFYPGIRLMYLLEMCGELLLVIREITSFANMNITRDHKTVGFEVFKVDESKGDLVEVKSLGDCALFVGGRTGSSFYFSAATDDDVFITRNCIYFTMHRNCLNCGTIGKDVGVFNLNDGSIGPIPFLHTDDNIRPLPIWVIPDPGI